MSKVKCIVRQGWTTRDADGNLIDRRDYVYVTDEDGTPHIYESIAEARAEIRANYGRDANRSGILHTRSVDDYTGSTHEGYAYIVREDTDEYAAATADAKTEAAAADMPEPIIYATKRTEATEPAPFEAEVQEWETLLIQIEENELVDTRTGERYTDGYRYILCTVSQFGNLSIHYGLSSSGKTFESCKRAANRMLGKYFNRHTADIVATGATLEAMHASATDETVHERFKVWAASLFPAEQNERAAVEAIAANMLEEYGNAEDATNATAYGVFADMHDGARPDDLEPADMEQMDRLITYAAEVIASELIAQISDPAERDAIEAEAIRYQWTPEEIAETIQYRENIRTANHAARAFLAAYADATDHTPADWSAESVAAHKVARDEITGTDQRASAADREIVVAMVEELADATRRRPTYQRHELESYLGEPDDYDVNAIEHEATAYDPTTDRIVWAVDSDELAEICERHQLQFYAPAF